jgi:signal transduction histidine kinase
MSSGVPGNVKHALRVAGMATGIVGLVYLVVVMAFDWVVAHRLLTQVDNRLAIELVDLTNHPDLLPSDKSGPGENLVKTQPGGDLDDAPIFVWVVGPSGTVVARSAGAPALPAGPRSPSGYVTSPLGSSLFRLDTRAFGGERFVAGVSLADQRHIQGLLVGAELIVGPLVLVGMFLGSLVIGVKASGPVERARLRQLEFTADASHELRTPLSVIQAEVDLALRSPRNATSYRESLVRVREESARLQRIVESLLWLARFDSQPPPPEQQPIDLATVVAICVERFQPLAEARSIDLRGEVRGDTALWVNAPAEWMERLTSVLIDNACRYSPTGGMVRVVVEARNGRVCLTVEDSGPGIPVEERPRLFDRFHRATEVPGGTGLGLAIANAVVQSTNGRWRVGDSTLGGALLEVSWRLPVDGAPDTSQDRSVKEVGINVGPGSRLTDGLSSAQSRETVTGRS